MEKRRLTFYSVINSSSGNCDAGLSDHRLLGLLSKLLERLVARRLLEYLECWTRLACFHDCSLHAYRANHSVETAVLSVIRHFARD